MPQNIVINRPPNDTVGPEWNNIADSVYVMRLKNPPPAANTSESVGEWVTKGNFDRSNNAKVLAKKENIPAEGSGDTEGEWINPPTSGGCAVWTNATAATLNSSGAGASGRGGIFSAQFSEVATSQNWIIADRNPEAGEIPTDPDTLFRINGGPLDKIIYQDVQTSGIHNPPGFSPLNNDRLMAFTYANTTNRAGLTVGGNIGGKVYLCPEGSSPQMPNNNPLQLLSNIPECTNVTRGSTTELGTVTAKGGSPSYNFSIDQPFTLGVVTGQPNSRTVSYTTPSNAAAGKVMLPLTLTDSDSPNPATETLDICVEVVTKNIRITHAPVNNVMATKGQATNVGTIDIDGGTTPYTFVTTPGLVVGSPANDLYPLTYTPPDDAPVGDITLTIRAIDGADPNSTAELSFVVPVVNPGLTLTTDIPNPIEVPTNAQTELGEVTASGGDGNYTFTQIGGSDLVFTGGSDNSSDVFINLGTNVVVGNDTRTIRVSDGSTPTKSADLVINLNVVSELELSVDSVFLTPIKTIIPEDATTFDTIIGRKVGTITANGGIEPYTFSLSKTVPSVSLVGNLNVKQEDVSINLAGKDEPLGENTIDIIVRDSSLTPQEKSVRLKYYIFEENEQIATWNNRYSESRGSGIVSEGEGFYSPPSVGTDSVLSLHLSPLTGRLPRIPEASVPDNEVIGVNVAFRQATDSEIIREVNFETNAWSFGNSISDADFGFPNEISIGGPNLSFPTAAQIGIVLGAGIWIMYIANDFSGAGQLTATGRIPAELRVYKNIPNEPPLTIVGQQT